MTKKDFINKLKKALGKLTKEEKDRYVNYYEEMISDLMENGASEEEAVEKQGSVEQIAKEILQDADDSQMRKKDKLGVTLVVLTILLAIASIICIIALPEAGAVTIYEEDSLSVFVAGKIKEPVVLYVISACISLLTVIYFAIKRRLFGIIVGIVALLGVGGTYLICNLVDKGKESPDANTENMEAANSVEAKTEAVIALLNAEDYETLQNDYAAEEMKPYLTKEVIDDAKLYVGEDWGAFVSNGKIYAEKVNQNGVDYTIAMVNSMYENVSVTYTITFDSKMKLAGLYMR